MERLVDYDKFIMDYGVLSNHEDDYRLLCAAKITAYTKDEVIAMLTEIQSEIKECVDGVEGSPEFEQGVSNARVQVVKMIQEKIDKLKGNENGNK